MTALRDRAAANDAQATASLARRITRALLTRSFRQNPGDWDEHEDGEVRHGGCAAAGTWRARMHIAPISRS